MIETIIFIGGVAVIASVAASVYYGIIKSFFLHRKLQRYLDSLASVAFTEEENEESEEEEKREFEWS